MKIKMWAIVDKSIDMVMSNGYCTPWLDLSQEGGTAPSVPHLFKARAEALNLIKAFGEQRKDIMTVVPVYIEIKTGDVS